MQRYESVRLLWRTILYYTANIHTNIKILLIPTDSRHNSKRYVSAIFTLRTIIKCAKIGIGNNVVNLKQVIISKSIKYNLQ